MSSNNTLGREKTLMHQEKATNIRVKSELHDTNYEWMNFIYRFTSLTFVQSLAMITAAFSPELQLGVFYCRWQTRPRVELPDWYNVLWANGKLAPMISLSCNSHQFFPRGRHYWTNLTCVLFCLQPLLDFALICTAFCLQYLLLLFRRSNVFCFNLAWLRVNMDCPLFSSCSLWCAVFCFWALRLLF